MRGSARGDGLCLCTEPPSVWLTLVSPAAGGPGPLPGRPGRQEVPRGGDHPEPQAQVPAVQGEQEGPDNVSLARRPLLAPSLCYFKTGLCVPCRLSMRHPQRVAVPSGQGGRATATWPRVCSRALAVEPPSSSSRAPAASPGPNPLQTLQLNWKQ